MFGVDILHKMYPVALQPEVCCLGVDLSPVIVKRLPPFLSRVWPDFPFPWKLSDFSLSGRTWEIGFWRQVGSKVGVLLSTVLIGFLAW